jgi:DNA topoisomerase-2
LPYFNGFKGRILQTSPNTFEIFGTYEIKNTTTILVTELPVGYNLKKYNDILTKLEEDKVIADYTDMSEPKQNKFLFEIKVPREFTKKDDEYIIDKLKLVRKITENYTCIGINNEIVEFDSIKEILDKYMEVRLHYYDLRKIHLIEKVKKELMVIGSKFYFVKFILEEKIKVFKTSKSIIIKQIEDNKDFPFYKVDDSFDYLLRMPIHSFSSDTIDELKKQISNKKEELKIITETSLEDMWLNDLKELKNKIK